LNFAANDNPLIEILPPKNHFDVNLKNTIVLCILRGAMKISYGNVKDYVLAEGNIMLFPPGIRLSGGTNERAKILVLRINDGVNLCEYYRFNKLYQDANTKKLKHSHLESNKMVKQYMDSLAENITNGIRCSRFMNIKLQELFCYLHAYYEFEELQGFILPMLSPNAQFMNFIWQNYRKVHNVKEFAVLANSSQTAFNDKFKKLTGMPPSKWLTEQKAKNVYHDIRNGQKSLKEISSEYQFSSVSHLGSFCRKNFGTSPKGLKLNKGNAVNSNDWKKTGPKSTLSHAITKAKSLLLSSIGTKF
jgi:AraC-like DNA-binding protein